jgi:hypothetical protein
VSGRNLAKRGILLLHLRQLAGVGRSLVVLVAEMGVGGVGVGIRVRVEGVRGVGEGQGGG